MLLVEPLSNADGERQELEVHYLGQEELQRQLKCMFWLNLLERVGRGSRLVNVFSDFVCRLSRSRCRELSLLSDLSSDGEARQPMFRT
jgi:hypothetical protein